jgi:hypothetical protein
MKRQQDNGTGQTPSTYKYSIQDPKPDLRQKCNLKEIEQNLEDAFEMFNKTGAKWSPVGGLEATVRIGYMTMNHTDIDIEIDETQLPIFKKGMETQGYKLFEKLISLNVNLPRYKKRFILYKKCNINKNTIKKQVRLIHNNPDILPYLLRVIDVKVCRHTDEGTTVNVDGQLIPINKPYYGKIIDFKGQPIQLRNIGFRTYIKSLENKRKSYSRQANKRDIDRYYSILLDTDKVKNM